MKPDPLFYNVKEVASLLKTKKYTVYKLIEEGKLKKVQHGGETSAFMIPVESLQEYIKNCMR